MTLYTVFPHRLARRANGTAEQPRPEVHIPVDVTASEDGYTLTALVPGLEPDQVAIEVLDDTVTLRGEFTAAEDEARYLLRERPAGRFSRTLRLPAALDPAKAEAEVRLGVLTVRVPKAESAKARQIKVKAK